VISEQTEEQASLYVLGLLAPEEAIAFQAEVAIDSQLADLVAALETGAAALAATLPPRNPPPALRGHIAARIKQSETDLVNVLVPFPGVSQWIPWAIAACLMVVVACLSYDRYHIKLLVDSFLERDLRLQGQLDHVQRVDLGLNIQLDNAIAQLNVDSQQRTAMQDQYDALHRQLGDLQNRDTLSRIKIATLASLLKNDPQAMAVIAWDPTAQRGILQPVNLPAAQTTQDYQLWIIDPAYPAPVSAGVFDPAKRANFQPLHPITKAGKFAISLEKKGGSSAPQGPIVLLSD